MCRHVRHDSRLAGSKCGVPGGTGEHSGRSHGVAARRTGLRHRDLAPRPGAHQFDGSTRPVVIGLFLLEEVQHMLCAIGRPDRKQAMVGVLEGAAATHSDEPGVSLLW